MTNRNIVICCDGTSNEFGSQNTNVVRLVQVLDRRSERQLVWYDPGVGTMPEPGFVTALGREWSVVLGLAFGRGLTANISEAYQFLMDQYEPGDRIHLFGFSRGAYTVRALAGVLHQFGLLHHGAYNLVPYVMKLAKAVDDLDEGDAVERQRYWTVCREFGATFARPDATSGFGPCPVKVRFLGVWDTVSSVGWVWDPKHFAFTARNPAVEVCRHAISIDEHRAFFRTNRFRPSKAAPDQDVRELWFPGVHCDVGGGYPLARSGLWREPFRWMVEEAQRAGLEVVAERLEETLRPPQGAPDGWADAIDESLTPAWWPAEFFPKLSGESREGVFGRLRVNLFRRRAVSDGALIHRAALERIRRADLAYRPGNLSPAFLDRVRALTEVPESLAYASV